MAEYQLIFKPAASMATLETTQELAEFAGTMTSEIVKGSVIGTRKRKIK